MGLHCNSSRSAGGGSFRVNEKETGRRGNRGCGKTTKETSSRALIRSSRIVDDRKNTENISTLGVPAAGDKGRVVEFTDQGPGYQHTR